MVSTGAAKTTIVLTARYQETRPTTVVTALYRMSSLLTSERGDNAISPYMLNRLLAMHFTFLAWFLCMPLDHVVRKRGHHGMG